MQLGDNNPGCRADQYRATVGDFRRRDMAYGGQGRAAGAFHQAVLGVPDEKRIILNIGGIANITTLIRGRRSGYDDTGRAIC